MTKPFSQETDRGCFRSCNSGQKRSVFTVSVAECMWISRQLYVGGTRVSRVLFPWHYISLCVSTAAGDDDGENEPRRAHVAAWRHRRQKWQRKPATRARPEGTLSGDKPPSPHTRTTTISQTDNSDRSTAAAATLHRRSRRDVRDRYTGPRWIRSGSTSTRIPTKNNGMIQLEPPPRRHRPRTVDQRLLTDRLLLLLQHRGLYQKRSELQSHSQMMTLLSTIIQLLSVNRGSNWSQVNANPLDNDVHGNSRITSDKIFMDKRASHRRRPMTNDFSKHPRRNTLNVRRSRSRPPIDPMLLMVGIGRK